jgi:mRNA interferase MazF
MKRGELYRVYKPGRRDPKKFRTYVIVSRNALIFSKFPTVACAPVVTQAEGLITQLSIGVEEGMKHTSWIVCDGLVSVDKRELISYVGSLRPDKLRELNRALRAALALNEDSFLIQ